MATISQIAVRLTGDNAQLKSVIAESDAAVKAFPSKVNAALNTTRSTLSNLTRQAGIAGAGLTAAITVPLVAIGKSALDLSINYQQGMNVLQATTSATGEQMKKMDALALQLGADIKLPATSALDATRSMLELSKAGLSVNDTMAAARGTLQLAAAGQIDVASASALTAQALNAFHLAGEEATRVADLLAAGANASAASVGDLAAGMQQGAFAFSAARQPIEHMITSLAALTNVGLTGSDAGTALKNAIIRLMSPTQEAAALMQKLHLSVFDAQGVMLPLPQIIENVNASMAGMSDQARNDALQTIFLSDGMKAMIPLLDLGKDGFLKLASQVTKSGAASALATAQTKGLGGAIEGFKSQVETFLITASRPFLDTLEGLVRKATEFVGSLDTLDPAVVNVGLAIAAAAAAGGPLLLLVAGLSAGLSALLSPIGLVVAAAAGLTLAWATNFLGVRDFTNYLKDHFSGVLSLAGGALETLIKTGKDLLPVIKSLTEFIRDHFIAVVSSAAVLAIPKLIAALTTLATVTLPAATLQVKAFMAAWGPWALLAAAVGVGVDELKKKFEDIKAVARQNGVETIGGFSTGLNEASAKAQADLDAKMEIIKTTLDISNEAKGIGWVSGLKYPEGMTAAINAGVVDVSRVCEAFPGAMDKSSETYKSGWNTGASYANGVKAALAASGLNRLLDPDVLPHGPNTTNAASRTGAAAAAAAAAAKAAKNIRSNIDAGLFTGGRLPLHQIGGGGGGSGGGGGAGGGGGGAVKSAAEIAADLVAKTSSAVQSGLQAIQKLAKFELPTELPAKSKAFAQAASLLMLDLQTVAVRFKDEALEHLGIFADAAGKGMQLVGTGVEALSKLNDFKAPTAAAIASFVALTQDVVTRFEVVSRRWGAEALTHLGVFSESASKAMDLVSRGADALSKLRDFVKPADASVVAFADGLFYLLNVLGPRTAQWNAQSLEIAASFAESAGKLVDFASRGVDALVKLRDFSKPPDLAVSSFVDSLDFMLDKLRVVVGRWTKEALEQASAFGDGAGRFLEGVHKGIEPLVALGTFQKPTDAAVTAFIDTLDFMLDRLRRIIPKWDEETRELGAAFGDATGRLVDGVATGIEPLTKLADPKLALAPRTAINAFLDGLVYMAEEFRNRTLGVWVPKAMETTAQLADFNGRIFEGVGAAIEPLLSLVDYKAPTEGAISSLFDGLDFVMKLWSERSAAWKDRATEEASKLAEYVGSVVSGISEAIGPLVDLADFLPPSKIRVALFFSALDNVLAEFASRSEEWKARASDVTAKLAENVGTVMAGVNAALEPILKMKDVQAISREQIEGAFSNIWFALHQLGEVMKSGELQGDFMSKAVEFSKALGEVFTNVKRAVTDFTDKTNADSIVTIWKAGLDRIFQLVHNVWGPQTKDKFQFWFDQYTTYFRDYTAEWVSYWQSAMSNMVPPPLPGGTAPTSPIGVGATSMGMGSRMGAGSYNPNTLSPAALSIALGGGTRGAGAIVSSGPTYNNCVFLDGIQVSDPDLHALLTRMYQHKNVRNGGAD